MDQCNVRGEKMKAETRERFLVDERGNCVAVVVEVEEHDRMIAELEELEDLRGFDAAKAADEKPIPFEKALAEIEQKRRKK